MRISDWSSDVCSSDLLAAVGNRALECDDVLEDPAEAVRGIIPEHLLLVADLVDELLAWHAIDDAAACDDRSEEHTSELQSLMRTSYAVFCFKQTNRTDTQYRISSPDCLTALCHHQAACHNI